MSDFAPIEDIYEISYRCPSYRTAGTPPPPPPPPPPVGVLLTRRHETRAPLGVHGSEVYFL